MKYSEYCSRLYFDSIFFFFLELSPHWDIIPSSPPAWQHIAGSSKACQHFHSVFTRTHHTVSERDLLPLHRLDWESRGRQPNAYRVRSIPLIVTHSTWPGRLTCVSPLDCRCTTLHNGSTDIKCRSIYLIHFLPYLSIMGTIFYFFLFRTDNYDVQYWTKYLQRFRLSIQNNQIY